MKKRLLSILLTSCLLFTLLPLTALAAPSYRLTVGNTNVSAIYEGNWDDTTVYYWKAAASGVAAYEETGDADDYLFSVCLNTSEGASFTLTLNGVNIVDTFRLGDNDYGIFSNLPLDIVLAGEAANSIVIEGSTADESYGVYASDALTISGDGSFSASGGTYGIASWGPGASLSIDGCTINSSGTAYGILVDGNIIISGGTISATDSGVNSDGIAATGDLTISGGNITASGNRYALGVNGTTTVSIASYKYRTNTAPSASGADYTLFPGTAFENDSAFKYVEILMPSSAPPAPYRRSSHAPTRTITVTETSSGIFSDARGEIRAEANMTNAFSDSVEVKVTDTDEGSYGFNLGIGNTVYPFDISLYIKGTDTRTEPAPGYAVTIFLPIPDDLLDVRDKLSVAHKSGNGTVSTLSSQLRRMNGIWYLVFEATEFSPYALIVNDRIESYIEAAGLPYYMNSEDEKTFIGFAAGGKYISPSGATVLFMKNPKAFTDIESHWADGYIVFVAEREIFLGMGIDTFSPDISMTRAMFAAVIGRLYERSYGEAVAPQNHAFADCDYGDYYGKYVDWAAGNGIISGYGNGKFEPDNPVTREQMASILYRFANFLGALPDSMDPELAYPDAPSISSYAKSSALYCQTTEIIKGRTEGAFAPQEASTRAEVAAVVQRFVELMLK